MAGLPVAGCEQPAHQVTWPVHCYGSVGVARDLSPDTGTGAELYAVIGHAPRQLDRNIAVVGRVIEGIEHLSTLPRGKGEAGVYDDPKLRVPIVSVRLGNELPAAEQPRFEYLATDSPSFAALPASPRQPQRPVLQGAARAGSTSATRRCRSGRREGADERHRPLYRAAAVDGDRGRLSIRSAWSR